MVELCGDVGRAEIRRLQKAMRTGGLGNGLAEQFEIL
jgi:hypothetical protein